jgi:hypothetical protein
MVQAFVALGLFDSVLFISRNVSVRGVLASIFRRGRIPGALHGIRSLFPARVSPAVTTFATLTLGIRWFSIADRILRTIYLHYIRHRIGSAEFVLLINDYLPTRLDFYKALAADAQVVVTDLSDDVLSLKTGKHLQDYSRALSSCMTLSHRVLCATEYIRTQYGDGTDRYIVFPNGLSNLPPSSTSLPIRTDSPVIGYMGTISEQRIDDALLRVLLREFPYCSFVFLGPDPASYCKRFANYTNFHYFAPVPYQEMLACVRQFDIAIIPHKDNSHTRGNSLLKLPIFLLLKVPVISTDVSDVRNFSDFVDITDSHEAFCSLLRIQLETSPKDAAVLESGAQRAQQCFWDNRCGTLARQLSLVD